MMAVTTRFLITFILICAIRCDTDIGGSGNDKLSQSREKDSKISQHEKDDANKVIVDNTGINVNQNPPVDHIHVKHASSNENKQPLDSLSDQGNGQASSKSQPLNNAPSNLNSPATQTSTKSNSFDEFEKDDISGGNDDSKFEESEDPEESLVEQMKKLSEKLKKGQEKKKIEKPEQFILEKELQNEEMQVHSEGSAHDVEFENTDLNFAPEIKLKDENVFGNMDVKDDLDDLIKNAETIEMEIDTQQEEFHAAEQNDEGKKKTIVEQMKDIEKKIDEGEIDIPSLIASYEEDKDDWPSEDDHEESAEKEIDVPAENLGSGAESDSEAHGPASDFVIDNTQPPASDILPSRTIDIINKQDKPSDENIHLRETLSLEKVKSTVHTMPSENVMETIEPTAGIEVKSTKKYLSGSDRKKMRLDRNKILTDSVPLENSVTHSKTVVNPSPALVITKETNHPELIDKQMNAAVDENSRYSATKQDNIKIEVDELETSEDKITGTIYDTNALKEAVVQETVIEEKREKSENLEPTTTETDDKVPVVSETLPPQGQDRQQQSQEEQQQSSSSSSAEETPEEKEKKAQAEHYFEEGEKLINNSYKKDFLQAYEYFKLAADLGHTKALEYLGFGHLLGDYVTLDPAKALKIFQDLSEKGSPKGQLGLGFSYSSGLAVNSSQAKALIYFTFAALGGDPLAQMVLGYRFLSGIGVESKCETALTYYRKVATTVAENTSSGSPVVQRVRLHEQAESKDSAVGSMMDDDLLQYYEFLADKGDVQAQVVLGQLYYQGGRGVPVNHERAHHYFLMAAESGNANAFAFLGKMHSEGSPVVAQDNDQAFLYFKKAADKSNPIGQCGLGIMHLYGKGVDKDYQKALKYFTQSSDQGWSDAQLHLGIMHFGGKGVRRDYKTAVKYFNLASQGGHVLAFYHLAQMHATGTGVLRNCHTAVELYKNVAERGKWSSMLVEAHELYTNGNVNEALLKYTFLAEMGYEVAQTNVAYILDNGESTLFDQKETYQRALLHWTRAASQGSSTVARLKMGDYHYYGYGTDIDYETAATHYRLATEQQHNAQAMFNLGYMHENGLGLKQDVHLAKRFYDMAAETSGDAYVPVTLALFKLGMFYGTDVFNKEMEGYYSFFNKLDIRYQLGPYWDIYLATFLAIALGICVVVFRQNR